VLTKERLLSVRQLYRCSLACLFQYRSYKKEMVYYFLQVKIELPGKAGIIYSLEPTQKAISDLMTDGLKLRGWSTTIEHRHGREIEKSPAQHATPSTLKNEEEIMNKEVLSIIAITVDYSQLMRRNRWRFSKDLMDQQNQQSHNCWLFYHKLSGE